MEILLATPLYPPDIGGPAAYVKELAKRLSAAHDVTILAYGHLPEQVAGVHIIAIDKRRPLLVRLLRYTWALWRASRNADIVYAQNGASVELPAAVVFLFSRRPLIMHVGDEAAHVRALNSAVLQRIEKFAQLRAHATLADMPPERPEILPFQNFPSEALAEYEAAWHSHVRELETLFAHAN